jgi:hypothetical protein
MDIEDLLTRHVADAASTDMHAQAEDELLQRIPDGVNIGNDPLAFDPVHASALGCEPDLSLSPVGCLSVTLCMVRPCVARGFGEMAVAVLHQCIRPLSEACASGHHGYQRA